jgi:methylmalonyl-CoA/ethylmalonyl-CoA epimerase
MIRLLNLDHVAVAVADLDQAVAEHARKYGTRPLYREVVDEQGVEEAMLPLGGSFLQLIAPLRPDSPVGRFIERNGPGLHHLAFTVPDIVDALDHLRQEGARLIDEQPRPGGRGALIAFVHPKDWSGTLIELIQLPET